MGRTWEAPMRTSPRSLASSVPPRHLLRSPSGSPMECSPFWLPTIVARTCSSERRETPLPGTVVEARDEGGRLGLGGQQSYRWCRRGRDKAGRTSTNPCCAYSLRSAGRGSLPRTKEGARWPPLRSLSLAIAWLGLDDASNSPSRVSDRGKGNLSLTGGAYRASFVGLLLHAPGWGCHARP